MKASASSISASDMRSKTAERKGHRAQNRVKGAMFCIALFFAFTSRFALCPVLFAAISDRVVAYADNYAITLSELEERYAQTIKVNPAITKEEVLNTMINRILMMREAKRMRLEATSEEELLKEYVDLKIKAFIRIRDEEMKEFYNKHVEEFGGKEYEAVRDEIEKYLTERELNQRLKTHIAELREKSCIQMQLGLK